MAKTGSISIKVNSQSASGCYSNVTIKGIITTTGESYRGSHRTGTYEVLRDNVLIHQGSFTSGAPANSTTTLFETTIDISHYDNGGSPIVTVNYNYDSGWCAAGWSGGLGDINRTFTVTFVNGLGSTIKTQNVLYGNSASLPSDPTRTGYQFAGWSGSYNNVTSNQTVTATWSEYCLTVNYYSNYATKCTLKGNNVSGVASDKNIIVCTEYYYYDNVYNDGLNNIQNLNHLYLERAGYTPTTCWGTSTSGGTLIDQSTPFTSGQALAQALGKSIASGNATVAVYPQWVSNTYTITYNANGGTIAPDSQIKSGNTPITITSELPIKAGHTFLYWSASPVELGQMGDGRDSNGIFNAKFVEVNRTYIKHYWIRKVPGKSNRFEFLVQADNTNYVYIPTWRSDQNGGNAVWHKLDGGSWERNGHHFNFGLQIDISSHGNTISRSFMTHIYAQSASGANNGTLEAISTDYYDMEIYPGDEYSALDNITLYAHWKVNEYTITYDGNEGTNAPLNQTFIYNSGDTISINIPTKAKHRFLYWKALHSGHIINPGDAIPADWVDVTLVAQWELIPPQNIYIYKNGSIYARDFIVSNEFYLEKDGTIYAPAFNNGNLIYLDKKGLTALQFIKGLPIEITFVTVIDKLGNVLIDNNNTILIAN